MEKDGARDGSLFLILPRTIHHSQRRSEIHLHQLSNSPPPKTRHNKILYHLLDTSQPTNLFVHKHQIHEDFVMIREDSVLFDFKDESTGFNSPILCSYNVDFGQYIADPYGFMNYKPFLLLRP